VSIPQENEKEPQVGENNQHLEESEQQCSSTAVSTELASTDIDSMHI